MSAARFAANALAGDGPARPQNLRKPIRRWFRFSLRAMLLATFVIALSLAYVARDIVAYRDLTNRNEAAARVVEKYGGSVVWGTATPPWSLRIFGRSWERRIVRQVEFAKPILESSDRAVVRKKVPREVFEALGEMSKLLRLNLTSTDFSVDDLNVVSGNSSIMSLCLDDTPVDDSWGTAIRKFSSLRTLSLRFTGIGDEGVREICAGSDPQNLYLDGTLISDSALLALRDEPKLESLTLDYTNIGDPGVVALSGNKSIERLTLTGTRVTNDSVSALRQMTSLKYLSLVLTNVDQVSLMRLKSELGPSCDIQPRSP